MSELRFINTLGKSNQRKLRDSIGAKTINQVIVAYGGEKKKKYSDKEKKEAYLNLMYEYNLIIEFEKKMKEDEEKKQKKKKKKTVGVDVFYLEGKKNLTESKLRYALKERAGTSVIVEYVLSKKEFISLPEGYTYGFEKKVGTNYVILTRDYDIPTKFQKWWKVRSRDFWIMSSLFIFEAFNHLGKCFIYSQVLSVDDKFNKSFLKQYFKDGITHCVFTPIKEWATTKLNEAITKQTKSRYNVILKDLKILEEKYKDGVPDDAISEICNKLQVDINIDLPFCENQFIEGKSIKKRLKLFKFMNTRLNHVELNEITNLDTFEIVSRKELLELKAELDFQGTFYTYKKDLKNICSISTLKNHWKINNEFSETISKFELDNGLNFCKIDDIDNYDLSQFILNATNYNETVDFCDLKKINIDSINHIDMEKAYANFMKCSFYQGFLGKITDFRKTNKIEGVGIYKITNLDFSQCSKNDFIKYNNIMEIYIDNNQYTSAELNFLTSMNIKYDIVCGCWGVKELHFQFNDDMLYKKDEHGCSYYAKWAGVCDSHILENKFWIKCDKNYFDIIKENCGNSINDKPIARWYENNEGSICFPKKHNYHLGHITAFITAYQRLSVIEQLLEIDYNNVIRVCVDGIYYKQENVILKNVFRIKTEKNFNNVASGGYIDKAYKQKLIIEGYEGRKHFCKELHLGEGGCGKTYYNCNDRGLQRVMFLSPSWKLAICKKKETDYINCSVWARALSGDPEKITYIKEKANVLIIDEVSMLSDYQKQQLFNTFGDMKLIFCGDLGYQLPCIEGEEMTTEGFDNIVRHNEDYRCKDEVLRTVKKSLRYMIENKYSTSEINQWVIKQFKIFNRCISVEKLREMYCIEDMILSGTNEVKDYYTNMFKGKFNSEKYYITENNRLYCNGEIVIANEKPEKINSEVRHCFTTHSIQGETAYHNLFIDSSKMFDSRMFYTAISRAKSINQIYIIQRDQLQYKYEFGKIYKIISNKGVYIGSTIQNLEKRFNEHKNAYEQYKNGKGKYITSFSLLDDPKAKIVKIEDYKCNDLKDLWKRESEIIQQSTCVNKTYNNLS